MRRAHERRFRRGGRRSSSSAETVFPYILTKARISVPDTPGHVAHTPYRVAVRM